MAHDKKVYEGGALVKQSPASESRLSRAKEVAAAIDAGNTAVKKIAALLSKDLPFNALTQAYHYVNYDLLKTVDGMKKSVNDFIKDWVEEEVAKDGGGVLIAGKTESGGPKYTTDVDYGPNKFRINASKNLSSLPDLKLLAQLVLKRRKERKPDREVSEAQCFNDITDEVVSREFSGDKVRKLIDKGVITQKDVDSCRVEAKNFSLKVDKL